MAASAPYSLLAQLLALTLKRRAITTESARTCWLVLKSTAQPSNSGYSIFELSVNTISGAPSFVRSLRKGWETTDILRNCKHPGRKRSSASANKYQQPLGAPSGRPPGTTSLFLWLGWGSTKTVFICRISNEKLAVPRALLRCE